MKTVKKLWIVAVLLIGIGGSSLKAQDYHNGVGIRLGYTSGVTFKHFIGGSIALEGILGSRYDGAIFTGLFEKHFSAFDVSGLSFFVGVGGHVGFYRGYYVRVREGRRYYYYYDEPGNAALGIDGIMGLEYTFSQIPLNLGIDIKPYFDILEPGIVFWDSALSIRFTF